MGTALLASALVIAGGLLADVLYAFLDPRVRHA
jgi:ABC-type dipeptide/oligopeptide/nickel transport system permease component